METWKAIVWAVTVAVLSMFIATMFVGCQLITIHLNVAQRSIMDKGDGTSDVYTKLGDKKTEPTSESLEIIPKLK